MKDRKSFKLGFAPSEQFPQKGMVIAMIVFDRLWETMKVKQVSTYTLREKHNFDNRIIRRLKANQNTTTDTLNKLCEILECGLEDIASYKKE